MFRNILRNILREIFSIRFCMNKEVMWWFFLSDLSAQSLKAHHSTPSKQPNTPCAKRRVKLSYNKLVFVVWLITTAITAFRKLKMLVWVGRGAIRKNESEIYVSQPHRDNNVWPGSRNWMEHNIPTTQHLAIGQRTGRSEKMASRHTVGPTCAVGAATQRDEEDEERVKTNTSSDFSRLEIINRLKLHEW